MQGRLQATRYRNYGSGLPKEAHIDISNFCANEKGVVFDNLHGILLIFSTFYDKKIDIGRWRSAVSNQRSGTTADAIFNGCRLLVRLEDYSYRHQEYEVSSRINPSQHRWDGGVRHDGKALLCQQRGRLHQHLCKPRRPLLEGCACLLLGRRCLVPPNLSG